MTVERAYREGKAPAYGARGAFVACTVGMMTSLLSLLLGTAPVFLEPMSASLGWGRSVFPTLMLVIALTGALLGPIIGRAVDRLGARPIALLGTVLWGIGFIMLSRIGDSATLRVLAVIFLGLGGGLAGQLVYARVLTRWFDRNRGVTLGVALGAAPAITQAIAVPVLSVVVATSGWRIGYLALGVIVLTVTLGVLAIFLHEPPTPSDGPGMAPVDAAPAVGESAWTALKSARFWYLTLGLALGASVYNGVFQHSFALLAEQGYPRVLAASFVSVAALAAIPSPILAGALLDRLSGPRLAVAPFVGLSLVGLLLIVYVPGAVSVLVAAALFGIMLGAGPALQPYVLSRYFGPLAQSEIFGLSIVLVVAGTASGPVLMGVLFDRIGNYSTGLVVLQVLAAFGLVLALLLPKYRHADIAAGSPEERVADDTSAARAS